MTGFYGREQHESSCGGQVDACPSICLFSSSIGPLFFFDRETSGKPTTALSKGKSFLAKGTSRLLLRYLEENKRDSTCSENFKMDRVYHSDHSKKNGILSRQASLFVALIEEVVAATSNSGPGPCVTSVVGKISHKLSYGVQHQQEQDTAAALVDVIPSVHALHQCLRSGWQPSLVPQVRRLTDLVALPYFFALII